MSSLKYIIFVISILISASIARTVRNGSIGFPESEEDISSINKDNRKPVYLPSMCPINELFYPGDQKDDWICDCRPAHLYEPSTDTCWPAYRQGPCSAGQYLTLPKDTAIPVCEKNPCDTDNLVMFNGQCAALSTTTPCRSLWPVPAALAVNATTLTISCQRLNVESRFGDRGPVSVPQCPPGCKRSINGKCVTANS